MIEALKFFGTGLLMMAGILAVTLFFVFLMGLFDEYVCPRLPKIKWPVIALRWLGNAFLIILLLGFIFAMGKAWYE